MMASAFDNISSENGALIRKRLLAGSLMKDIRRDLPGIDAKTMRKLRDEVFTPLLMDPQAVKDLANGPMLNATAMVRLPYAQTALRAAKQKAAADALTDNDREVIRERRHGSERASFGLLAQIFGVHANTIRAICKTEG